MKFKVGEFVKSSHTGFIYRVIELRSEVLFLHRTNCKKSYTWTPSYDRAQGVLSRVESTEYPPNSSFPEIIPDPKTQHCKLCILCQANPARSCDCNKPKPKVKVDSKFAEEQPIVLRQGWDNITNCGLPGYLHMNSDTTIYVASYGSNSGWRWESKFNSEGQQMLFSDNTALALMKQVEDYLKQSN